MRSTRLGFFAAPALALCAAVAACGSEKTTTPANTVPVETGNTGNQNNTANPVANANNVTGTTPASCTPSGKSSLSPTSANLGRTVSGNTTPMEYVLFTTNPNASNANQQFALTAYTYDYCAFSYDYGYNGYPLTSFVASSYYLVNGTPGQMLANGDYTVGATTGMYIYGGNGSGSGVTLGQASSGGQVCNATFPTMASGKVTITGGLPSSVVGYRNVANVTGQIAVTLSDSSTISGGFTSGTCSATNSTPPASPGSCGCTLSH